MARQSLKADPIHDAVQYLKETLATTVDDYEHGNQEVNRLRSQLEMLEEQQAQRRANYERIQAALTALEEPSTAGNGQDIPDVTPPSTPHLVPLPTDDWVIEEVEVEGEPEQPHAEEHEPPPPEAA